MSSSNTLITPIEHPPSLRVYETWTCFEGVFTTSQGIRKRVIVSIKAKSTLYTLNTFVLQKVFHEYHDQRFSTQLCYQNALGQRLGEYFDLKVLDEHQIERTFESSRGTQGILYPLRFICPVSSQPYFGHFLGFPNNSEQEELIAWALLQIRSQSLKPLEVPAKLLCILKTSSLQLAFALSRRGGISYQGATFDKPYQRSQVE